MGQPFYSGYGVTLDVDSFRELREAVPAVLRFRPDRDRTLQFLHAAIRSTYEGAPAAARSVGRERRSPRGFAGRGSARPQGRRRGARGRRRRLKGACEGRLRGHGAGGSTRPAPHSTSTRFAPNWSASTGLTWCHFDRRTAPGTSAPRVAPGARVLPLQAAARTAAHRRPPLHRRAPVRSAVPTVITLHDVLGLEHPEWFTRALAPLGSCSLRPCAGLPSCSCRRRTPATGWWTGCRVDRSASGSRRSGSTSGSRRASRPRPPRAWARRAVRPDRRDAPAARTSRRRYARSSGWSPRVGPPPGDRRRPRGWRDEPLAELIRRLGAASGSRWQAASATRI